MFKRWFRVPSPAFIVSLIALFLALGGTGYASGELNLSPHTDAKDDTKLVKKLAPTLKVKYAKTAGSAVQLNGVAASHYQRSTLPSGQTERGPYSAWGSAGDYVGASVTFPIPLAAGLGGAYVHFIAMNATPPAECPGTHESPEAASGHLCVYETTNGNSSLGTIDAASIGSGPATDRYGFSIYFTTSGSGGAWSYGTWAVTG